MSVADSIEWRWVDVDGNQSAVGLDELMEALSSEALPHFTLVWRTGWTDWLSANKVADLASAFGIAHPEPITVVRLTESTVTPPAPPLERYRTLAPGHVGSLLRPERAGAPSTMPPPPRRPGHRLPPPPPPPRSRLPLPGVPGTPLVALAPIPVRDVLPTLAGEEPALRSATLRPVGGMPPPPRTMPRPKLPMNADEGEDSSVEEEVEVEDASADVEHIEVPPMDAARLNVSPTPPPLERQVPPRELTVTQPSASDAHTSDASDAFRPSPVPRPPPDLAGVSRQAVTRATAIGVLLPGTLLLIAALVRLWLKPAPGTEMPLTARAAPVVASARRAPAPPPGCSIDKPAVRLGESAFVGVPVLVATTPDGAHAAVGFAAAKEHARGLTLDPLTLETSSVFEQTVTDSATLGVVPLARGKTLEFMVDRMDPKLASARTIDAATRFTLGVTSEGLSRAIGQTVTVVWPGKSKNPTITTPRVASVTGLGHAVAFRHGGQEGKVLVGWLTEDGAKQSDLKVIGTDATLVGTPTISASESAVLVAFASKIAPAEGWRAELAVAPRGGLPERANPMVVPPGGPGGEAISPSSEVLADGRFLVQWTEGSAGNRAVRAQALSANLVPIGEPVTLSTPEQNAGQGALWVHGTQALALFLVKKETSHELWGASLRCP
jgi:hypothetical protein